MKAQLTLLTLLTVLVSVGQPKEGIGHSSFSKFCETVPVLRPAIRFTCSTGPEQVDYSSIDTSWLREYLDDGASFRYLVGSVFPSKSVYTLIIRNVDDNNTPMLFTFDQKGSPIDTLQIGGHCFDAPAGVYLRYGTLIDSDRSITIADSNRSYLLDPNEEEIVGSASVTVKVQKFSLQESGHFVLTKSWERKLPK